MGLDTSHGCWHGSYSAFMRWRTFISYCVMKDRGDILSHKGIDQDAYIDALNSRKYDDQTVPINFLLRHSDCDGHIPVDMLLPIADALQAMIDKHMPDRALYDTYRPATERFIKGLRLAARKHEPVEFG